ncbi:orotidine-5'-phosphate decarboxylase [Spirulina sp. 06S082]|nr:orotidine-5'-phosphate decarboxylase [Spirulina sp. 06S082]
MNSEQLSVSDRIIVPLDVPTPMQAIALIEKLPQVTFWKVGFELFISAGAEVLKVLKQRDKRIFLDLKLHDIPNTVVGACTSAKLYDIDFLTIHATSGRKTLEMAAEVARGSGHLKLLAVTLLTSINSRELAFDLKIPLELPEYVLQMALLAQESGISGAICSPREAGQLREICDRDFLLVCPGVRPSWSERKDQQRVMTPGQAIAAGADYLVIGRPITQAANPLEAWERICEEVAGAM